VENRVYIMLMTVTLTCRHLTNKPRKMEKKVFQRIQNKLESLTMSS